MTSVTCGSIFSKARVMRLILGAGTDRDIVEPRQDSAELEGTFSIIA